MSTKIYSGFRVHASSLVKVQSLIGDFQQKLEPLVQARLDSFVSHGGTWPEWCDRRARMARTKMGDPAVDTDFELLFYPRRCDFLGVILTAHQAWQDLWLSMPGVQEYSYWDNSDRPDEISAAKWRFRKIAWDVLDERPLAEQMFAIRVTSQYGPQPK